MRPVGNQAVDMVACQRAGGHGQFALNCDLAEQVAAAEGHRPNSALQDRTPAEVAAAWAPDAPELVEALN
jgi:hypothetical protein